MILVRGPRFVPPTFARGFSGSSDKINWGNSFYPLGKTSGVSWSAVAWFTLGVLSTNRSIATKRSAFSTGNNQFGFYLTNLNQVGIQKDGSFHAFSTLSPILSGQTYVAGVNGTSAGATGALNDSALETTTGTDWTLATDGGSNPFEIGNNGANEYFSGSIALVALFTPALTDAQLKAICQRRVLPWIERRPSFLWMPRHDKAAGYDLDLISGGVGTISGTTHAPWNADIGGTHRRFYIPAGGGGGSSVPLPAPRRGMPRALLIR